MAGARDRAARRHPLGADVTKACYLPDVYCAMYGSRVHAATFMICNYCGGYRAWDEHSPEPPRAELLLANRLGEVAMVWEPGRVRTDMEATWIELFSYADREP